MSTSAPPRHPRRTSTAPGLGRSPLLWLLPLGEVLVPQLLELRLERLHLPLQLGDELRLRRRRGRRWRNGPTTSRCAPRVASQRLQPRAARGCSRDASSCAWSTGWRL